MPSRKLIRKSRSRTRKSRSRTRKSFNSKKKGKYDALNNLQKYLKTDYIGDVRFNKNETKAYIYEFGGKEKPGWIDYEKFVNGNFANSRRVSKSSLDKYRLSKDIVNRLKKKYLKK